MVVEVEIWYNLFPNYAFLITKHQNITQIYQNIIFYGDPDKILR